MSVKVFIAHAVKDDLFKDQLNIHLSGLKEEGLIQTWDSSQITAGMKVDETLSEELEKAKIYIPLLSADFMASKVWRPIEKKVFKLEYEKELIVVPVKVRPYDSGWRYSNHVILPHPKKAISHKKWGNPPDEAYTKVTLEIRDLVERISKNETITPPKPPGLFQRIYYRFGWMIAGLIFLLAVSILINFLLKPAKGLPAAIEMKTDFVEMQFLKTLNGKFLAGFPIIEEMNLSGFQKVTMPATKIKIADENEDEDNIYVASENQINILPSSTSSEARLTLFNIKLEEWEIPENSKLNFSKRKNRPFSLDLVHSISNGELSYTDSLEFYTEYCEVYTGDSEINEDVEGFVYAPNGKVFFNSISNHFQLFLDMDFSKKIIKEGVFVADSLKFYRSNIVGNSSFQNSILSGTINFTDVKEEKLDDNPRKILILRSSEPILIDSLIVEADGFYLKLECPSLNEVVINEQIGNGNKIINLMPSRLDWLWNSHKTQLIFYGFATTLLLVLFLFRASRKY